MKRVLCWPPVKLHFVHNRDFNAKFPDEIDPIEGLTWRSRKEAKRFGW